jgi:hypothetical protein
MTFLTVLGEEWQLCTFSSPSYKFFSLKKSVALVRQRSIPTERMPLIGEVSANFLRIEGGTWPV